MDHQLGGGSYGERPATDHQSPPLRIEQPDGVRQLLHLSAGGHRLRIRLTNQ
jgi:hypothetical protein